MKKLIISFVCLVIISSSSLFSSPFHGGDGSSSNPYQIYNETELLALVNANDATTWSQHYILTNNITCSSSYTATIGNYFIPFTGSFDGQGHSINNLTYNLPNADYIGLFGVVSSATITNINLVNANILASCFVGSLVGLIKNGTINNCSASGYVVGKECVGGLIGHCYIENVPPATYSLLITNCSSSVEVLSISTDALMYSCAGGLIGQILSRTIVSYCYATGNVTGNKLNVGGLVGRNLYGILNYCFAKGNVISSSSIVGGLTGGNYSNTMTNCYATGNIIGNGSVGGFSGDIRMCNISNCYATGSITSTLNSKGGFCGTDNGSSSSFTCCYWDTQTSGLNYGVNGGNVANITGLSDLQMRVATNFPCFDKTTIWAFDGLNYPQLQIFYSPDVPTLTEWSRYILVISVLLFGCYFVYRKLYA